MVKRLLLYLMVTAWAPFAFSQTDGLQSGAVECKQSIYKWTFAIFSPDQSGSCIHACFMDQMGIIKNVCNQTVYLTSCRMKTATGIPLNVVKCSPGTELYTKLDPYQKGYQVPNSMEYTVPRTLKSSDVDTEFLVLTTSFDPKFHSVPGYRPKGNSVEMFRDSSAPAANSNADAQDQDDPDTVDAEGDDHMPQDIKAFLDAGRSPNYIKISIPNYRIRTSPEFPDDNNENVLSLTKGGEVYSIKNVRFLNYGAAVQIDVDAGEGWVYVPYSSKGRLSFCESETCHKKL